VSLTENFDLDTKEGQLMFAVLAAAAEYELELRAACPKAPRLARRPKDCHNSRTPRARRRR
jgi:DNA invertase Pin-like site-specific DNA recombinase